jgi:kinesin family protein 6/9
MFQSLTHHLDAVLDGYNSTIFAYGQTGAGKTFTLTGGQKYSQRGMIPRTIEYLWKSSQLINISCSYIEIHNETINDLLAVNSASYSQDRYRMKYHPHRKTHRNGFTVQTTRTETELLNLLFEGSRNRMTSETMMNKVSSRSHCIFTLYVETKDPTTTTTKSSKLHLVDLAGSEDVHRSQHNEQTLREGKAINLSLHYLEQVIVQLRKQKEEQEQKQTSTLALPTYRNSLLTSMLKDSLGGNCRTVFIACMNPELTFFKESMSTLRFGERCSDIKTFDVSDHVVVDLKQKNQMNQSYIAQLEQQLNALQQQQLNRATGMDVALTENDHLMLQELVEKYLSSKCVDDGSNHGKGKRYEKGQGKRTTIDLHTVLAQTEHTYRTWALEDMDEEEVAAKIEQAYTTRHMKNRKLQAVYDAKQALILANNKSNNSNELQTVLAQAEEAYHTWALEDMDEEEVAAKIEQAYRTRHMKNKKLQAIYDAKQALTRSNSNNNSNNKEPAEAVLSMHIVDLSRGKQFIRLLKQKFSQLSILYMNEKRNNHLLTLDVTKKTEQLKQWKTVAVDGDGGAANATLGAAESKIDRSVQTRNSFLKQQHKNAQPRFPSPSALPIAKDEVIIIARKRRRVASPDALVVHAPTNVPPPPSSVPMKTSTTASFPSSTVAKVPETPTETKVSKDVPETKHRTAKNTKIFVDDHTDDGKNRGRADTRETRETMQQGETKALEREDIEEKVSSKPLPPPPLLQNTAKAVGTDEEEEYLEEEDEAGEAGEDKVDEEDESVEAGEYQNEDNGEEYDEEYDEEKDQNDATTATTTTTNNDDDSAATHVDPFDILHQGTTFLKYGKKGKPKPRFVWLSKNNGSICWRPIDGLTDTKKTKKRKINVASLRFVVLGRNHQGFQPSCQNFFNNPTCSEACLSLLFESRCLDLQFDVPSKIYDDIDDPNSIHNVRQEWVAALFHLVPTLRFQRIVLED